METIDTLVFDYGGVIVNIDDTSVIKAMEKMGVTPIKRLLYARKIKRLVHQYINGLVPEHETLKEVQCLCHGWVTIEDIQRVLVPLCGNLPKERLDLLSKLRGHYKIYLLSNINGTLWKNSVCQMKTLGYSPDQLFDEVFLSYVMKKAKPSVEIYQELAQKTGLNPASTLYFDDREDNAEAGRLFGFKSVYVKTNHLEERQEWHEILKRATC